LRIRAGRAVHSVRVELQVPSLWAASLALSDPDQQPRQIGEMSVGGASYSSRSSGFPGLCRTCVAGSRTCGGPERSKPVSSFWRSEGGRSFTLGCRCPMGASSTATSSPAVAFKCFCISRMDRRPGEVSVENSERHPMPRHLAAAVPAGFPWELGGERMLDPSCTPSANPSATCPMGRI
jgi:hypothetical protein